jgi:geranylgeranyl reductase family protein
MSNLQNKTVAVVGGGPAGSAAAIRCAILGCRVLLIDKARFPRDKVCGDGIPAKVLNLLSALHIPQEEVAALGYPIYGMTLHGPSAQKIALGSQQASVRPGSFCIPRKIFDHFLFEKARARANHVYSGREVKNAEWNGKRWLLTFADASGDKPEADLLIAADGATSLLARKILGLPTGEAHRFWGIRQYFRGGPFPPLVRMFYDRRLLPGYFWIFPVAENRANVGMMVPKAAIETVPIQKLFEQVRQTNGEVARYLENALPEEAAKGAPLPLGTLPGTRVSEGFVAIGDAASFVNPVTGGGIFSAMLSGIKAAEFGAKALSGKTTSLGALLEYERWWRRTLLPGFRAARWLARPLADFSRADALFSKMQKYRLLRNLFFAMYGQPLSRFFYLRPGFWARIVLMGSKAGK